MALGDSKLFNDFVKLGGNGTYNLGTDGFTLAFVSDAYSAVNADATNPAITDYTVVSGGNIPATTALGTLTWTRSGATSTFDYADPATFAKNASNPATAKTILIYQTTTGDLYKAVDITTDGGTTPADLVNNDLTYTVNASGSSTWTAS